MSKNKNEKFRAQLAREYDVPASILRGDTEAEIRENVDRLKEQMPALFETQRDRDLKRGAAIQALRDYGQENTYMVPNETITGDNARKLGY